MNPRMDRWSRARLLGPAAAGILLALSALPVPALGAELFGFKLDVGVGTAQSELEGRGYAVRVSHDRTFPRNSFIEILKFQNDFLPEMQLSVLCYRDRVYLYRWSGSYSPDAPGAAKLQKLVGHLTTLFGEPEVLGGSKAVDEKRLAALAAGEGEGLSLVWTATGQRVELALSAPLFPGPKPAVEFSLRYVAPDKEAEVLAYIEGK